MTSGKTRIAINGFGRIGRTIARLLARNKGEFDLVLINDIAPLKTCAYLFQYDSIAGVYPGTIQTEPAALIVDGQRIPFHCEPDLRALDLSGVDVVLECTGAANDRMASGRGLVAGAKAVLVSGPSEGADITVVLGANEHMLTDQQIISNASCTTNALAPLVRVLDDTFGIESGQMTTVHCYTGSQPTIDAPRGDLTRSRAAALSMIPTTTSAARLIDRVLPHLAGLIEARAIRVPTASVSSIDLVVRIRTAATVDDVNKALFAATRTIPVLGWCDDPLVSSDLRGRPESLIICPDETSMAPSDLLRVFGWYDNESGFSNRMLDMARLIARRQ
ncbi:type I glyceraldehyde-3-phosphate dehydrogenase [Phaeovulum sp.]|uniref:type I glyceraldehyde-3-phosphate dehydrogenase n=1 Tax=Phaeovulum sp. TaxID=2934796 RepID=UPI0039E3D2DC